MANWDTVDHILWTYEPIREICTVCGRVVEYELTEIGDERVCDRCASNLTLIRNADD